MALCVSPLVGLIFPRSGAGRVVVLAMAFLCSVGLSGWATDGEVDSVASGGGGLLVVTGVWSRRTVITTTVRLGAVNTTGVSASYTVNSVNPKRRALTR